MEAISGTRRAMKEIPLSGGMSALIDASDYPLVSTYTWCAHRIDGSIYAATNIRDGESTHTVHMHRLLMTPGSMHVDHINGDGLDNRRENLRVCTNAQNRLNSRRYRNNTSGAKGVSWCKKTGKWYARIAVDGRRVFLGFFPTINEASDAYAKASSAMHGAFGRVA